MASLHLLSTETQGGGEVVVVHVCVSANACLVVMSTYASLKRVCVCVAGRG